MTILPQEGAKTLRKMRRMPVSYPHRPQAFARLGMICVRTLRLYHAVNGPVPMVRVAPERRSVSRPAPQVRCPRVPTVS